MGDLKIIGPGFQGSDKSGCEVSFYPHQDDPVTTPIAAFKLTNDRKIYESSKPEDSDIASRSGVSSLTWSKSIGQAAGQFSIDVKTREPDTFLRRLNDDDWVDIVFTQHAKKFHTVRGFIDEIQKSRTVTNGATAQTITITGRDFGKVWESTPIFFNLYLGKDIGGGATLDRLKSREVYGDVAKTVSEYLFAFLSSLSDVHANARWVIPPGVPGLTSSSPSGPAFFRDSVQLAKDFYSNWPARLAFHPHMLDPEFWGGHTLWDLAKEWADPFFCELFVDLVNPDTLMPPGDGEELLPENSVMAVTIRDKPFPTGSAKDFGGVPYLIGEHPWFTLLPTYTVTRQELGPDTLTRGGAERYNTFFVKTAAMNESSAQNINLTKPLWYPEDIAKRGIRRMDASTNYHEASSNNDLLITTEREMLRDWYGLNAYFTGGTLSLNHLRPDIRVGTRVRIPGPSPELDETFYVEGLTHQWRLGAGRTTLTVTRGWTGTDASLVWAISGLTGRYTIPLEHSEGEDSFHPERLPFI